MLHLLTKKCPPFSKINNNYKTLSYVSAVNSCNKNVVLLIGHVIMLGLIVYSLLTIVAL